MSNNIISLRCRDTPYMKIKQKMWKNYFLLAREIIERDCIFMRIVTIALLFPLSENIYNDFFNIFLFN